MKIFLLDDNMSDVPGIQSMGFLVVAEEEVKARELVVAFDATTAIENATNKGIKLDTETALAHATEMFGTLAASCIELGEAPSKYNEEGVVMGGQILDSWDRRRIEAQRF